MADTVCASSEVGVQKKCKNRWEGYLKNQICLNSTR